jgi:hypothetical protein
MTTWSMIAAYRLGMSMPDSGVDGADAKGWTHDAGLRQFSRAALAITSMASGWRDRTLSESAPLSSQAR